MPVRGEVTVLDAAARPVAGAEVVLFETIYDLHAGQIRPNRLAEGITDGRGHVPLDIATDPAREVTVVARKRGLALGWDHFGKHAGPQDSQRVTIVLDKPAVLAGAVVDAAGEPIGGAPVTAMFRSSCLGRLRPLEHPHDWLTVTTDAAGRFCFDNVPPDAGAEFLVTAPRTARLATYAAAHTAPGCRYVPGRGDVRLVMLPEGVVCGRVVNSSRQPVGHVQLLARPVEAMADYRCLNRTHSEADGRFRFEQVSPGPYTVEVLGDEWTGRDVNISVSAGQMIEDVAVRLSRAGRGATLDILTRDNATGQPIADAQVTLRARITDAPRTARTGRDGLARIQMPPGQCQLSVLHPDYYPFGGPYRVKSRSRGPQVVLLNRVPCFAGMVRDVAGRPVADMVVDCSFSEKACARTDAAGRFAIQLGGMPGQPSYTVMARCERRNLAGLVTAKEPGDRTNITVRPGVVVTGQVVDTNDNAVPAARVALTAVLWKTSSPFTREAVTDAAGRFAIPAVPPPGQTIRYGVQVYPLGYAPLRVDEIALAASTEGRADIGRLVTRPLDQSVAGAVVDVEGRAVPGKIVHLGDVQGGPGQPEKHLFSGPDGCFVFDRIGAGLVCLSAGYGSESVAKVYARAGDMAVTIVVGRGRVHAPGASLVGRPLTDLGDVGLEPAIVAAQGQSILLCLWAHHEPSSQQAVQQLAREAGRLDARALAVMLVNVSTARKEAVGQWCTEHRIPFPVGFVAARNKSDLVASRRIWGAETLPWLILTDRNHIVTAEGFPLETFDERVKAFGDG